MYNEVYRTRYRIGVLSEVEYRQARARAHWWVWQIDVVWRNAIKNGTGNYGRCPDVCTLQKIEVSCRRYEGDWYCWYTETGNYGPVQIFVHDKEWKACGAEMEDIGVGDALIVISCHGNRSE